jgi:hypothetical protein
LLALALPIPRQEFVEALGGVVLQAGEDVGEPSVRIDVIDPGGVDQGVDRSRAATSFIGTRERPVVATDGNWPDLPLGGIVGDAQPPIVEEARQGDPSGQAIGDGFAEASLKLKHVDLEQGHVFQDGRTVATKRGKSITTWFFPVGELPLRIVTEWIGHLRGTLLWGNEDALFPKTKVGVGGTGAFEALGLERGCWSSASPIRELFRDAFTGAGLPYFNPHSFRNTLAQLGERRCANAEAFKSWSQNLGHEGVLTTLTSYGAVEPARQAEIMRSMWQARVATDDFANRIAAALQQAGIVR